MEYRDIELNGFAIRAFRDVADRDYIAARLVYRARLTSQFLWLALQAVEKYTKCILLLNRIDSRKVGHRLSKGFELIEKHAPFSLQLSESSKRLIEHLDTYGRFRYLETSYYVQGLELCTLDWCVWEIRRYCQLLNYEQNGISMLKPLLRYIESADDYPRQHFKVLGGHLEKIVEDSNHPARPGLIWHNLCFGKSSRTVVRPPNYMESVNSPLSLRPQILDSVLEYVFLPKEVVEAYRKELTKTCS